MKLSRDLLVSNSPLPAYYRLAAQIRQVIDRGMFAPDEQLPSEQAIAEHFYVSRPTVRQALAQLGRDRLIRRVHGRGTFVNQGQESRAESPPEIRIAGGDYSGLLSA